MRRRRWQFVAKLLASGPLIVLLITLATIAVAAPAFYRASNITNVLRQVGILGIVSVGQTIVILAGGVDLSVGAIMSVALVATATITQGSNDGLPLAALIVLGLALAIGALNGYLVTRRRVPPFVATLATLLLVEGAILAYTRGALSGQIPPALITLGTAKLGPITYSTILFLLAVIAAAWLLRVSIFGRAIYAIGLNREVARLSGIGVERLRFATYLVSAAAAMAGGFLLAGYVGYVDQYVGQDLNLDSIAAVIIGGTSLAGGRGGIGGTVVGVVLLEVIVNVVFVANVPTPVQLVLKGGAIVASVVLFQLASAWNRRAGAEA